MHLEHCNFPHFKNFSTIYETHLVNILPQSHFQVALNKEDEIKENGLPTIIFFASSGNLLPKLRIGFLGVPCFFILE